MSIIESFIAEIEQEAKSTRKLIERIPADQFDWQPHEKSRSLKKLATHVVQLSGWPGIVATTSGLDFADMAKIRPVINNTEDLLGTLDKGIESSIENLKKMKEEDLQEEWTLMSGDHVLLKLPKINVLRTMSLNHMIHHRAQLGVYLRLLDIPIPGMYGPSADDRG